MRRGQAPPLLTIVLIVMPGAGRSGGVQGVKGSKSPRMACPGGLVLDPLADGPGCLR